MRKGFFLFYFITIFFQVDSFADSVKTLENAIVTVKVEAIVPDYLHPWQKHTPENRLGQGITVGRYDIVTLASLVQYHSLIQVQTAFQDTPLEATVVKIDWDSHLVLLSVEKSLMEHII